jgi:glycerol-3-phosphate dehydrogenase subunit B
MLDLLVIGAGLAGLSAAISAVEAGLTVKVVSMGLGTTHWSAGTIDVFGFIPGATDTIGDPIESIAQLDPSHPYRLVGPEMVEAALHTFQRWVADAGLPYVGAEEARRNLRMPSPVGALRPTLLTPTAQYMGDAAFSAPMLIVGFHGLRDFYPQLIAENLCKQGLEARAEFLPWELLSDLVDRNTIQIATGLDDPARIRRLADALRGLIRPGERLGLPAVIGLERHCGAFAELESAVGTTLFEVPTLPPSVPGTRLYHALRNRLQKAGVRIETNMRATDFDASGNRIDWVSTEGSARPLKHRARAFVLATGGILGGGFQSEPGGRISEIVFDLPLTVAQDRTQWFHPEFFDPRGQPVFRGGVAVDARLQPLISVGASPAYENLWAAGSVLAGADPILERSLEGIAVSTGIAAAHRAGSWLAG